MPLNIFVQDTQERSNEQAACDKQRRWKEIVSGNKEVTFSGSLTLKKVDELPDITFPLCIGDTGNKDAIITFIKAKLKAQPELQDNPRFVGHYPFCGHKQPAPVDENCQPSIQPSATHCHLDVLVPNVNPFIGTATAGPSRVGYQPIPGPSCIFTPYQPPQYISYPNNDNTNNMNPHLMHPPIRNTLALIHNQ